MARSMELTACPADGRLGGFSAVQSGQGHLWQTYSPGDGALVRLVHWVVVLGELPEVAVVGGELPEVAQAVGAVAVAGDEIILDLGLGLGLGVGLDLGQALSSGPRYKDGIQR